MRRADCAEISWNDVTLYLPPGPIACSGLWTINLISNLHLRSFRYIFGAGADGPTSSMISAKTRAHCGRGRLTKSSSVPIPPDPPVSHVVQSVKGPVRRSEEHTS